MPAPSASLDTAALRKARGAFFTPEPLARYVTEWAVRSVSDSVLEPSCGEASFPPAVGAGEREVDVEKALVATVLRGARHGWKAAIASLRWREQRRRARG